MIVAVTRTFLLYPVKNLTVATLGLSKVNHPKHKHEAALVLVVNTMGKHFINNISSSSSVEDINQLCVSVLMHRSVVWRRRQEVKVARLEMKSRQNQRQEGMRGRHEQNMKWLKMSTRRRERESQWCQRSWECWQKRSGRNERRYWVLKGDGVREIKTETGGLSACLSRHKTNEHVSFQHKTRF